MPLSSVSRTRFAPDEVEHHTVRRPDQTLVVEPVGFVTRQAKVVQQLDREVLVQLNLTRPT